jgi:hypothetical protein
MSIDFEIVIEYLKERGWTNSERNIPYREVVMLLAEFAGQQVENSNPNIKHSFSARFKDSNFKYHEIKEYKSLSAIKKALRKLDVLACATIVDNNQDSTQIKKYIDINHEFV